MDSISGDLLDFCAITNAAREAVNRTTGGTDAEDLLKAGWKLAFADKSYKCMRDIIRFQVSVRDQAGEEQVLVVKLQLIPDGGNDFQNSWCALLMVPPV